MDSKHDGRCNSPVVPQEKATDPYGQTARYTDTAFRGPLSVGVLEPQVLPSQLNTVEFYWDPTKRTSLFLQVSLRLGQEGGWKSDGGGSSLHGKEK